NILGPLGHGHCAVTGSFTAAEPLLGPLQDNGGAGPTHALLAGSPAVDFTCGAEESTLTDQRGVQHLGAAADLGAYERALCGGGIRSGVSSTRIGTCEAFRSSCCFSLPRRAPPRSPWTTPATFTTRPSSTASAGPRASPVSARCAPRWSRRTPRPAH